MPTDREIVKTLCEKLDLTSVIAEYDGDGGIITLDLSNKNLRKLPPEIGQLTSLRYLYLYKNQLSQLPAEIGQLTGLQRLNLRSNQLSRLLPEIGQLIGLQRLDLDYNRLSELPPEIGQLTSLQELSLHKLPSLQSPPPEIIAQGTIAILAYLRGLLENSITRYEAKLLIVGEGGNRKIFTSTRLTQSEL